MVLAPAAATILNLCLRSWGRASAGNFDMAAFFLSPAGLASILGVGCVLVSSLYFELAGLVRLLADHRVHWWEAFRGTTRLFPRLLQLGLVQVAMYLALAVPFLAGIGLVYWWLWSGKDLNGLIVLKPPAFWWGAGIAASIAVIYAIALLWLVLRHLFALPILILEPPGTSSAVLRASAERSRGMLPQSLGTLAGWFVMQSLLASIVMGLFQALLVSILKRGAGSISAVILVTGLVLLLQALGSTLVSVLGSVSLAGVLLRLYRRATPAIRSPEKENWPQGASLAVHSRMELVGWKLAAGLLAGVVIAALGSLWAMRGLRIDDRLQITAHRAGAIAAPENTVAALKQAIADRADWAEIDVQLAADREIVVMHDIDLARVGGGNRRVDQASLAEIQALDVGMLFGEQFKGERVPTLRQMLAAAGDHIRLNIELKPHGRGDAAELTRRVIEQLREVQLVSRCRLCSQSYEGLQQARQLEPQLELGYIEGAGVGDSTLLDVDFLMVKSSLATPQFVARAAQRGKQVHAWTVNDPEQVAHLLDAGVANLITDKPALMRSQLEQIRALSAPERLLLRTANAIAR